MSNLSGPRLDACGCCESHRPLKKHYNRPGRSTLDYRLGIHSTFLARMLAALPEWEVQDGPNKGYHPLSGLTTRDRDDPSIAFLDAWAAVADVLAFYQERIANEGYLRTATERRSILELARTIGYELGPGVSASTFLAFTVEDAPGAPGTAAVPKGVRVQSIPGEGQLPQIFETGTEITARAEWNALQPRMNRPQKLAIIMDQNETLWIYLLGIDVRFPEDTPGLISDVRDHPDEVYLMDPETELPEVGRLQAVPMSHIYLSGISTGIKKGDRLLFLGRNKTGIKTLFLLVERVSVEQELNRTRVDFGEVPEGVPQRPPSFRPVLPEPAIVLLDRIGFDRYGIDSVIKAQTWRERDLSALISIQGWDRQSLVKNVNAAAASGPSVTMPALTIPGGFAKSREAGPGVEAGIFSFGARLGIFGNNAPYYSSLPVSRDSSAFFDWDKQGGLDIWHDSKKDSLSSPAFYADADLYLERSQPGVLPGSWLVLETSKASHSVYHIVSAGELSPTGFAMSTKATGLEIEKPEGGDPDKPAHFKVRNTTAYAQSERLILAELPIDEPLAADSTMLQLDRMILGLQAGQPVIVSGEREDLPGVTGREVVFLYDILHNQGFTTIFFTSDLKSIKPSGLKHSYIRRTVRINANIVTATHGETIKEVLGSGDGSLANQRFVLKKPPLTYVSASTPGGRESTLQILVNGVSWKESPRLYGLNDRDLRYIVRIDEDRNAAITFGDGKMGARLPTGTENITATYRSGIGMPGALPADRLTLLQTRPQGIHSVTNPLPTAGAAEPEDRDSARANAPGTVLTMERIVSLKDFEDFVRAFAGIGKARAVSLRVGEARVAHITIASSIPTGGADDPASALATHVVDAVSDLYRNLVDAMRGASDPVQRFIVNSYQPLFFNLKARLRIDPRCRPEEVLIRAGTALKLSLSFDQRSFGQPVTLAEVIAVIQKVRGVEAVDVEELYSIDKPPIEGQGPEEVLKAGLAHLKDDKIKLAQLLLINPVGIKLEEMKL